MTPTIKDIGGLFRAMNANWTSRIFVLCLLATGLYGWLRVTKAKCEDCNFFKEQNKQLIATLLEIKTDVAGSSNHTEVSRVRSVPDSTAVVASKPFSMKEMVVRKINSTLLNIKSDSNNLKKQ